MLCRRTRSRESGSVEQTQGRHKLYSQLQQLNWRFLGQPSNLDAVVGLVIHCNAERHSQVRERDTGTVQLHIGFRVVSSCSEGYRDALCGK